MEHLKGVNALVSGGATELGSEVIRELAERGASIVAVDSTEEKIEAAIAKLGLEDPDEIFTSAIEGDDLVSWWDLANLIAAYAPTLNFFVHIAEPAASAEARSLGVETLRSAQAAGSESLLTAVARLEKYLIAASEEDAEGACVVAVTVGASQAHGSADVLGSAMHATSAAVAAGLSKEYEAAALNIRAHGFRPNATESAETAASIVLGFLDEQRSA